MAKPTRTGIGIDLADEDARDAIPLYRIHLALRDEIAGGAQRFGAAACADAGAAALLRVEPRAAMLRIDRVVRGVDGRPLLYTSASYRVIAIA